MTLLKREPALALGAVNALLTVAAAWGLDLSRDRLASANVLAAALVSLAVRSQVTPVQ